MKAPFLFVLLACTLGAVAQPNLTPGAPQSDRILILGGTAHIGNGEAIENAAIGFVDGFIDYVGTARNVDQKRYDRVVQAQGMHVYPGFIAPNSTLGLMEVAAVRASRDYQEVGTFKPNVRSIIAYNAASDITPTVRTNGVLMGQITPRGGVIGGSSSVVQFDAWNWEDAVVRADDGIHLYWPSTHHKHFEDGRAKLRKRKTYDQQLHEITDFFERARAYSDGQPEQRDLRMEAMRGLFVDGARNAQGATTLFVHANDAKQIAEVIRFKRTEKLDRVVLVGGLDSWMMADPLRENDIAVMLLRTHSVPRFAEDDIDLPYKLPKLLEDEGVEYCLQGEGRMPEMNTRNLPFYAGTAVAYGLEYEQAVRALTLSTAKILGIDETCGSIERGKDATLFISGGDALDMMGNDVRHAWVQGRDVALDNKQIQLYEKYKAKYDAQRALGGR
ncbi:MAG: amidohydrolase family protein [Flavobacteriales bacterium]|nr:amidohydrolase family protein [Flavobacteriales bacterium]